jgi:DNA-binding response OmpR family regulator
MTFKLLIAEDARDVAEVVAFGARMTWPGCQVTIAADGAEALQSFADDPPDLVVLDVEMPKLNGFEVCQRIRATSEAPILMLTVRESTLDKVRALDLGADDYLTKPFDHLELLARLRALVRRARAGAIEPGPALTVGELHLDFTTHEVRVGGEMIHLTSTEYRLLEELVRNAGIVLTHRVLLDRVWGPEYGGDAQYLKVFVRRLRQKLGDDAAHPRYIQTEWGIGYRFVQPPNAHA